MVTLLHMLLAEADRSLDGCETVCQDLLEVLLILSLIHISLT